MSDQFEAIASPDAAPGDTRLHDAALALAALGHKPEDAAKLMKAVSKKLTPQTTVEELIRMALTR
jgi:holliday junction DNA helicase RuvA